MNELQRRRKANNKRKIKEHNLASKKPRGLNWYIYLSLSEFKDFINICIEKYQEYPEKELGLLIYQLINIYKTKIFINVSISFVNKIIEPIVYDILSNTKVKTDES